LIVEPCAFDKWVPDTINWRLKFLLRSNSSRSGARMWNSARVVVTTATRIRSVTEHLTFEHRASSDCDLQTATYNPLIRTNSETRPQRNQIWIRQGVPGGQVTSGVPRTTSDECDVRLTWLRALDSVPKHAFCRPNGLNQPDHRLGIS
jgi:hypothetical protein